MNAPERTDGEREGIIHLYALASGLPCTCARCAPSARSTTRRDPQRRCMIRPGEDTTMTCRNCGRTANDHDDAFCQRVHLGGIPRPPEHVRYDNERARLRSRRPDSHGDEHGVALRIDGKDVALLSPEEARGLARRLDESAGRCAETRATKGGWE